MTVLRGTNISSAISGTDDAVLYQQYAPAGPDLAELLAAGGTNRIVIYQATGMIAAQLDDTVANALARLRAAAFASRRPIYTEFPLDANVPGDGG